ncbi:MAG TPA: SRPBCC family protein [Solirubrobacteraceae bacterium]|nr:SRPBCC family protein [Solirubrobacteraceae bacterium]
MARTERVIEASAQAVFDVLADPRGYAYWVIGSMEVRDADDAWPQRGSRFHHTVGMGPLRVKDHTRVEEVEPGRFLQLQTKARPLGNARVKLELEPAGQATKVTMIEDPADKPTAFVFMPLTHLLIRGRNVRSLDRLAELAEGRVTMPGDEPGAPAREIDGEGSVENPEARRRRRRIPRSARVALGIAAAGLLALAIAKTPRFSALGQR